MNRSRVKFRDVVLVTVLIWFSGLHGCSGKETKVDDPKPPVDAQQQPTPPPLPTPPTSPQEVFGPPTPPETAKPIPSQKPKVGLVIGGAGVASFATVGILKRFAEEGIQIDYIIATGWPALFAVGYGFLRSVHDLEWFAMRLQEKDFYASGGLFEVNKDYASHERLSKLIENSFTQRDLSESRLPVLISAANAEPGESELYEKGDWKAPLLKTMSVPGIYRPYPENDAKSGTSSLQGLAVDDAVKRGGTKLIVAVDMYEDYFNGLKTSKKASSDAVFRRAYLAQMKTNIAKEMKQAALSGKVSLGKAPNDFAAKRNAILQGYKEGARIARELRTLNVD